jgi:hypothetical protein
VYAWQTRVYAWQKWANAGRMPSLPKLTQAFSSLLRHTQAYLSLHSLKKPTQARGGFLDCAAFLIFTARLL